MISKIFPIFVAIIFFIIFIIFYKGLQNSNVYVPNTNIKKDIPVFKAKIFDTDYEINSKEIFKNEKFYLMNIWSSWCVPCKNEHPYLINLSKQQKIEIIGLNYKDNEENAKRFLQKFKSPYKTILSDKDGTIAIEWGAYGVPESYLIFNKKIIRKISGPIDKKSLEQLKELIQ